MEEVNGGGKRREQDEVGQVKFHVSDSGAAKKKKDRVTLFCTRLLC